MIKFLPLFFIAFFVLSGCSDGIPEDIQYEIVKDYKKGAVKRQVDVFLNKKPTKEIITLIAEKINDNGYDHTFVIFTVKRDGWIGSYSKPNVYYNPFAKVSFAPSKLEPDFMFYGTNKLQDEAINKIKFNPKPNSKLIFDWYDFDDYSRFYLYKTSKKYFIEYHIGSTLNKDGTGNAYIYTSQYIPIKTSNGKLKFIDYDKQGLNYYVFNGSYLEAWTKGSVNGDYMRYKTPFKKHFNINLN